METYPYDWKGTNPDNLFTEERIITGDNPTDRVVILKNRPFFAAGFSIISAGAEYPLVLGTDYELVYEMPELDDSVASPVFNGFQLINPDIGGTVICTGQQLGGSFYTPFVDMLDEIVKYLNNPVDADWFKVENRPSFYPPMEAATSWADLVNKKYVASAVHDVDVSAEDANALIKSNLDALKVTVKALGDEIAAFNYPAHIAAHNPHNTTPLQADAHPVSLKTPDTFLAYGKTLRQLISEIRVLGLKQSDIDQYIEKWVSNPVTGVFVQQLAANRSLFKSSGGTSEITFTDTSFILKSNGSVVLTAGYSSTDSTVRFMEWVSGTNTLRIESSGNALGMDKLTLNGKVLLTTTLLMGYQPTGGTGTSTDPDEQKVYIRGANGLNFTGEGTKSSPLKGTISTPVATTTVKGVAKLKSGPGTETQGVAATPDSLRAYEGKAGDYVPTSTMLNSKAMDDGERTLTKADIGLGSVDNTRDVDKPLSIAQTQALQRLSPKVHKHDFSELALPEASTSVYGLARYTDLDEGLEARKGVTPNLLKRLSDRLDVIADAVQNVRPGMTTNFSVIDGSTWQQASGVINVKSLRYFYLVDGQRGEGEVSGSINLATSPMFNWFSPDNTLEDLWGVNVNTVSALPTNFTTPPPLPFSGTPVSYNSTAVGDVAVNSVITKTRLKTLTGQFQLFVTAGGPITIYVDGAEVASGPAPLSASISVDKSRESYCIGIRADCTDPKVSAAIAYEIYDEDAPLSRSGRNPTGLLSEFVPTTRDTHRYLYLNMISESLFCREEPVLSDDINVEYSLIGVIATPASTNLEETYTFQRMLDYGATKEVSDHAARKDAHIPKPADWKFSDNPLLPMMGKLNPAPRMAVLSPDDVTVNTHPLGAIRVEVKPNRTGKYYLFLEAVDQTPQSWYTPYNPHVDNHKTLEGGMIADVCTLGAAVEYSNMELMFVGPTTGVGEYRQAYHLRLPLTDTDRAAFGSVPNFGMDVLKNVGTLTFNEVSTYNSVKVISTKQVPLEAYRVILGLAASTYVSPRAIIRYRYDYDTRVMRVLRIFVRGGKTGLMVEVKEWEYTFDVDVSGFMRGAVGVCFDGGANATDGESTTLVGFAAPVDINAGVQTSDYHYFRSLYESYVGVSAAMNQAGSYVVQPGILPPTQMYSDVAWISQGLGIYQTASDNGIPHLLNRGDVDIAPRLAVASQTSTGGWCLPIGSTEPYRLIQSIAVGFKGPLDKPIMSANLLIQSTLSGAVIFGGHSAVSFSASPGGKANVPLPRPTYPGRSMQPILIYFNPSSDKTVTFQCSLEVKFYTDDGSLIYTLTEKDSGWVLYDGGPQLGMYLNRPNFLTDVTWEQVKSVMEEERAAGSGVYGVMP